MIHLGMVHAMEYIQVLKMLADLGIGMNTMAPLQSFEEIGIQVKNGQLNSPYWLLEED
jgi:hypothetical protein